MSRPGPVGREEAPEPTLGGLVRLAFVLLCFAWSTARLLTHPDPGPYKTGLGLAAAVVVGVLVDQEYRARRPRRTTRP